MLFVFNVLETTVWRTDGLISIFSVLSNEIELHLSYLKICAQKILFQKVFKTMEKRKNRYSEKYAVNLRGSWTWNVFCIKWKLGKKIRAPGGEDQKSASFINDLPLWEIRDGVEKSCLFSQATLPL